MAVLPNQFVQVTTEFTTQSLTYIDVPGATLPNANFVAGRKYLIYITSQQRLDDLNDEAFSRMVHGSTPFAESEMVFQPSISTTNMHQYQWWTVYTAVAGEDVKLQVHSSGTPVVGILGIDQITMVAIEISEELVENTDFFFAEDNAVLLLTPTFQDGASITFTPGTAGDDWLVLSRARMDPRSNNVQQQSRISRTGEATSQDNLTGWEAEDHAGEFFLLLSQRIYNLGAVSNTFTEQARVSTGANNGDRTNSGIFALNLSKLASVNFAQADGNILTDTTNAFPTSTQVQTLNFTPSTPLAFWINSSFIINNNTLGSDSLKARQQVDGADQPPTQTSDDYDQMVGDDVADERAFSISTIQTLGAVSHDVDLDVTSSVAKQLRNRFIFAMPLFAGTPIVTNTTTFTNDALLLATQTNDFTVDGIVVNRNTNIFTIDARIFVLQTETFTVDTLVMAIRDNDFSVSAIVKSLASVVWQNDALLKAFNQTFDFTIDAKLIVRKTTTFSADAVLNIPVNLQQFSVDARITGQVVTPDEDISNAGGWVPQIFPTLFQELDNIDKNPGQFIRFDGTRVPVIADSFEVGMSPMADPNRSDGHVVTICARSNTPGPVADDLIKIRIKVFQDLTTLIATTPFFTMPSPTIFTVFQFTLTASEADAITNYMTLSFRGEPILASRFTNTFSGDAILV